MTKVCSSAIGITKSVLVLAIIMMSCNLSAASQYRNASMVGKPDISRLACGTGNFWDPRNGGECWSCGNNRRTVFPVTGDKACKIAASGQTNIAVCPKGTFLDLRNGGECWSCPSGSSRTAAPVTSPKACSKRIGKKNAKATYSHNTGSILKACKKGTFANVGSTKCYKCTSGYKHNGRVRINKNGVCYKPAYTKHYAASQSTTALFTEARKVKPANIAKVGCDRFGKSGFFDPTQGGSCWRCPESHNVRTVYPVTGDKACAATACGALNGRPCNLWERVPSCNKGLAEDFVAGRCISSDPVSQCKSVVRTILGAKKKLPELPLVQPLLDQLNKRKGELERKAANLRPQTSLEKDLDRMIDDIKKDTEKFTSWIDRIGQAKRDLLDVDVICGDGRKTLNVLNRAGFTPDLAVKMGLAANDESLFPDLFPKAYASNPLLITVHIGPTYTNASKVATSVGFSMSVDPRTAEKAVYFNVARGKSNANWGIVWSLGVELSGGPIKPSPTIAYGPYLSLGVDAQQKLPKLVAKFVPTITASVGGETSFTTGETSGGPSIQWSWDLNSWDVKIEPKNKLFQAEAGIGVAVKILYFDGRGNVW